MCVCVCSCNQFVIDQWTLLNLHPSCCLEELVSYSRNLSSFYHLSHTYQPVTIADRPHSLHVAGNHRNTITVKPEIVCIDLNTSDFFISLSSKKGYHQFKSCLFFLRVQGIWKSLSNHLAADPAHTWVCSFTLMLRYLNWLYLVLTCLFVCVETSWQIESPETSHSSQNWLIEVTLINDKQTIINF